MWCACVIFPNSSLSKSDDIHKRKRKQLDNHLVLCGQWSKAQSGSNHRTLLRWIKLDVKITWKPMLAQKHIHMQYRDNIEKKKIIYTVCVFIADFLKQINNKGLFELEKSHWSQLTVFWPNVIIFSWYQHSTKVSWAQYSFSGNYITVFSSVFIWPPCTSPLKVLDDNLGVLLYYTMQRQRQIPQNSQVTFMSHCNTMI